MQAARTSGYVYGRSFPTAMPNIDTYTRLCSVTLILVPQTDPSLSGIGWPKSRVASEDPILENERSTLLCLRATVLASPDKVGSRLLSAAHADLHGLSLSGLSETACWWWRGLASAPPLLLVVERKPAPCHTRAVHNATRQNLFPCHLGMSVQCVLRLARSQSCHTRRTPLDWDVGCRGMWFLAQARCQEASTYAVYVLVARLNLSIQNVVTPDCPHSLGPMCTACSTLP